MDSHIHEIITKHNLKQGDEMRNIDGEVIPQSKVISNYCIAIKRDYNDGYDLFIEDVMAGTQTRHWFSDDSMAIIKTL